MPTFTFEAMNSSGQEVKDEIDAIKVAVRQINRRDAAVEFERAQKRLMTAQAKVELLAKPVTHSLAS